MIILLDTSSPICHLTLVDNNESHQYTWQADRTLADGLIRFIREALNEKGFSWSDISGIGVFQGPGSFTGLRIGLTVMNILASDKHLPIIGGTGDDWQKECLGLLHNGGDHKLVMPKYGRDATITTQRK